METEKVDTEVFHKISQRYRFPAPGTNIWIIWNVFFFLSEIFSYENKKARFIKLSIEIWCFYVLVIFTSYITCSLRDVTRADLITVGKFLFFLWNIILQKKKDPFLQRDLPSQFLCNRFFGYNVFQGRDSPAEYVSPEILQFFFL